MARVTSLGISSRVNPTASRAAILAMGNPVALEASADDRETRGFISMTRRRPVAGSTANCTLEPPVSTPTARRQVMASSRISWYSWSERVCAGATVIESPVCTPIGSRFSMEQTTTALSLRSRITSSSNSFHPATDSSTSTPPPGGPQAGRRHRPQTVAVGGLGPVPPPPRTSGGAHDHRVAELAGGGQRLVHRVAVAGARHLEPGPPSSPH